MDDPAKVVIALGMFTSVAVTAKVIANAVIAHARLQQGRRPGGEDEALAEQRLARIEQAVDAIAVEVERISEGQRFTTRLLSERAAERGADRALDRGIGAGVPRQG